MSINVRVRVLDLAQFLEDWWNNLEDGSGEFDQRIILDVSLGEGSQVHEARIGVSEDSVAVSRDDFTLGESVVSELSDFGFTDVVTEFFL